jgi:murein DD-endopeptidase MepM/ murein hydrolase activator NlpD
MAKTKYYYNKETCQYEVIAVSGKIKLLRGFLYTLGATIVATATLLLIFSANPTPKELSLHDQRQLLDMQWHILKNEISAVNDKLANLQVSDEDLREILELESLPAEIREAGIGGKDEFKYLEQQNLLFRSRIIAGYQQLGKLRAKLNIETLSLDTLAKYADNRDHYWSHIPAIQPVANGDLRRLSTVFGMRLNPVLGKMMPHRGFDFMAKPGTPIYAPGDGVVTMARMTYGGFGNLITIDHGYGYKTRYAHLNNEKPFAVKVGDRVKRGQLIGYMGNTGRSKGPHLHYEVLENGHQVNPIGFFQRELETDSYARLLALAEQNHQPMD